MKIVNTMDPQSKPPIVLLIYGEGGVGKTSFTATAPKPLLADCEGGAKYFGLRGISVDVAHIEKWSDMKDFLDAVKDDKYETIVIDPIGELMDKLKLSMISAGDSKLIQRDGSPTMAGWGWLKKTMRQYIKAIRDVGKHVIIVAHLDEKDDDGRIVKRPKVETKLSDEIVNMVDVVAYMTVIQDDGKEKRILRVDPTDDKYTAKDRTGQLGTIIPPDFNLIIKAIQGSEKFQWSKGVTKKKEKKEKTPAQKKLEAANKN